MKKLPNLFSALSVTHVEMLTSIVTETLVTSLLVSKEKKFSTADLWNIQRQGKMRIQRRYSL